MKPRIGILLKHLYRQIGSRYSYGSEPLAQTIRENGGVPLGIFLPEEDTKGRDNSFSDPNYELITNLDEILCDELQNCNGIVLQGGSGRHNKGESSVLQFARENNIPLLGICAGHQLIARAYGGEVGETGCLDMHIKEKAFAYHEISIEPNTLFESLSKRSKMVVNSNHRYAVKTPPKDLICSAYAPDGSIEVLEDPKLKFLLSTQFHPENSYSHEPLLQAFIEASKSR